MSNDNVIINRIRSYSSGVPGRSINNVRNHHLVIDEPSLGEAMSPADVFLTGVSACAVGLIESVAARREIPLARAEVTIEGVRDRSSPTAFARVGMRFELFGVSQEQAEGLVDAYRDL